MVSWLRGACEAHAYLLDSSAVSAAMDEMGLADREGVRRWYDGFAFGSARGIYNPWSITNYLAHGELEPWWANTSSNAPVSSLVATGAGDLQHDFEALMAGGTVDRFLDERVSFRTLNASSDAAFSLLLAGATCVPSACAGRAAASDTRCGSPTRRRLPASRR